MNQQDVEGFGIFKRGEKTRCSLTWEINIKEGLGLCQQNENSRLSRDLKSEFVNFFSVFSDVHCGKIRRSDATPVPEDGPDIDSDYPTSNQDGKMDKTVNKNFWA